MNGFKSPRFVMKILSLILLVLFIALYPLQVIILLCIVCIVLLGSAVSLYIASSLDEDRFLTIKEFIEEFR